MWDGGSNGRKWDKKEVLDIRNVLGPELLTSPYVTRIGYVHRLMRLAFYWTAF